VVAIDHRGHGRGIRSRQRFRMRDCADDAAALIDHLAVERVIACGYSMGGPIAQLLWRRHPARVGGLVLCATSRVFAASGREKAMFTALGGLSLGSRVAPGVLRRRLAERLLVGKADASPIQRWVMDELRRSDPTKVLEAGQALGRFDSREWAPEIDVPTAVLVTSRDNLVHPSRQLALAAAIPGATIHRVPGDHTVCVTGAGRFVPALVEASRSVAERAAAWTRTA
jgi:3-oxoadipate enol-lactonase